jgi:hypothetical protein
MRTKFLLSVMVLLASVVIGGMVWRSEMQFRAFNGKWIPPWGLTINEKGSRELGNPDNAIQDLTKLYTAFIAYRQEKGKLPEPKDLFDFSRPIAPGIQLKEEDLRTPDAHLADGYTKGDQSFSEYALTYLTPRPNGQPRPAFPKDGERDVWLYCETYARTGTRVYRDHTTKLEPMGYYVVLWSDGVIEKVPTLDMVGYQDSPRSWTFTFKGQAGLPKNTRTKRELAESNPDGSRNSLVKIVQK